jgi:NH3-dependent NAD+ synthetase
MYDTNITGMQFNAKSALEELTNTIKQWAEVYGKDTTFVIEMNGDIKTLLALALFTKVVGKHHVVGVDFHYIHDGDHIYYYNRILRDHFGNDIYEVDSSASDLDIIYYLENSEKRGSFEVTEELKKNATSRIHAVNLLAITEYVKGKLVSTAVYDDKFLGEAVIYGDMLTWDCSPFGLLTYTEVLMMAGELDIPQSMVEMCKYYDEKHELEIQNKYGFNYTELDGFLRFSRSEKRFLPIFDQILKATKEKYSDGFQYELSHDHFQPIANEGE